MLTPLNSIKRLRCYEKKRQKAWCLRLTPYNAKDAWRGPTPSVSRAKQASWLNLTNYLHFVFRVKSVSEGVEVTRYTLRLSWRQRWYIDIPLNSFSAAALSSNLTYPIKSTGINPRKPTSLISTSNPSNPSKFLENFLLGKSVLPVTAYLNSLWTSVFKGVGGVSRLKIRYKGKSFKWHRRKSSLMLRFGHSHLVTLSPYPGIRWKRFGRMKIVLFGSNWWDLIEFAQAVCWWRPVNVYHGRGLRLRKQAILRKAGKVSAYR